MVNLIKVGVLLISVLSLVFVFAGANKVSICHTQSEPNHHTIVVDDNSIPAHLSHGDYMGVCIETGLEEDEKSTGNDHPKKEILRIR